MKFFILSALLLLCSLSFVHATAIPADSIGMEKVDGKVYVLHQVEQKETLYSLSKRYDVKIAAITEANHDAENGLSIGQILRIPVRTDQLQTDGKVVHTVQPKETLYSIAREYKVDVEDIKKWNNMSLNLLDIGQKITIYPVGQEAKTKDVPERNTTEVIDIRRHTVQGGETLYSISRKYNASLENLRSWNDLQYNDISIGQEIIVGKDREKVKPVIQEPVTSKVPGNQEPAAEAVVSENVGKPADIQADETETGSTEDVKQNDSVTATREVVYNLEENQPLERENTNYEEVEEDGLAQLIDGSGNNRKYLALHRTAPVGTIMRVRNDMNGQEVFVRIIGKLPDTGANRNVLLKISRAAYEQLGAIDNQFRVRISFIP